MTKSGSLTYPEFCVGMYFIRLILNGGNIPLQLPENVRQQVIMSVQSCQSASVQPPPIPTATRSSMSNQGNQRPWLVTPAEKAQFDAVFRTWDPQGSGYITGESLIFNATTYFVSGDRAKQIFIQSGLHESLLAHIW